MRLPEELRLTEIDDTNIALHARLAPADKCLFLFEYTSGERYDFSATNSLISNIKKKPGQKGAYYKDQAIAKCVGYLRATLNSDWLATATLVPVPPSKVVSDPFHDPRMERICRGIAPGLDVRCIVRQIASTIAAHEAGAHRPTVEEVLANYAIDESQVVPAPKVLGIVDDVLTAGTHFRAMEIKLHERWPGIPVFGIFVARRVFPTSDFDEWPELES